MENKFKNTIKTMPLSIPMGVAAAGTIASLWLSSKRVHMICGAMWLGISAVHTWQHCQKVKNDAAKVVEKLGIMDFMNIPQTKFDLFVRSVEVSSYIPGRVRLYSKALVGNQGKCREVLAYLQGISELNDVKINDVTGSILIMYNPEVLRTNKELTRAENYIRAHARR